MFENKLAQSSIYASVIGYAIYLNDIVVTRLSFDEITTSYRSVLGFSSLNKLHLLFFGLLLLALARGLYLLRRPLVIRFGPSEVEWVNFGLTNMTFKNYREFHSEIRNHEHRTHMGKYYDDDWNAFVSDAIWQGSGQSGEIANDDSSKRDSRKHVNFANAKQVHESLLRNILKDRYYEHAAKNKVALVFAVLLASSGYILFLLPNLDLTLTIICSLFQVDV